MKGWGTVRSVDFWPFDDPPDVAVISTRYVMQDRLPILLVSHDDDEEGAGEWSFAVQLLEASGATPRYVDREVRPSEGKTTPSPFGLA